MLQCTRAITQHSLVHTIHVHVRSPHRQLVSTQFKTHTKQFLFTTVTQRSLYNTTTSTEFSRHCRWWREPDVIRLHGIWWCVRWSPQTVGLMLLLLFVRCVITDQTTNLVFCVARVFVLVLWIFPATNANEDRSIDSVNVWNTCMKERIFAVRVWWLHTAPNCTW